MSIDKALPPRGEEPIETGLDVMVAPEPELVGEPVVMQEGDIMFQFGDPEPEPVAFDANLAETLSQDELSKLGAQIVSWFEADDRSREDWKKTYIRGLDLLGLKSTDRTTPWAGACGVWHPVMAEAVVRFQAQAIMEIFPASGPVKTKIVGRWSEEKEQQATRVKQELNYFIQDRMTEYRAETETLLFYLALAGSAFRKIFYDASLGRPMGRFIPAEDFVVPYGTTDIMSCPRYSEVMRVYPNDVRKLQVNGFYRDVDLSDPVQTQTDLQRKYDTIEGRDPTYETGDQRYTLIEMHVDLDLPGFEDMKDGEPTGVELPYVVTVDKDTNTVLAIRRNWKEGDRSKTRIQHYVRYQYLPGLGFYGSGLIHLIGGIASSATSILRQLVDAGTLSNLPGGLKTRGLRIKGDDTPIMPGEFRDVDVPMGSIRDNITFLPYKEPSAVLFQLMTAMVDEGRKLGAAPDLPVNAMTQQAPVGTTLALLERSMKVMSAVQARLHASLKQDFKLIANVIKDYMPPEYEYEVEQQGVSRKEDFDSRVDIIPESDPNAASMAQRVVQFQSALDLAKQNPGLFDQPELIKDMLTVLGMPNVSKLVKDPEKAVPMDPVTENMSIMTGKPVKAFQWQDHEAHIAAHMAAAQDPKILQLVGQSPQASLIQGAMAAHVTEHIAMQYRKEIEKQMGVALPPEGPLPPEVEVPLSKVIAEAAGRLLQKDKAEAAQQQAQQQMQDPVFQLQMREVEVKEQEVQRKAMADQQDFALKQAALQQKAVETSERIRSQERVAGAALGVKIATSQDTSKRAQNDALLKAAAELADIELRQKELRERSAQGNKPKAE
jgi:hypothetical protein